MNIKFSLDTRTTLAFLTGVLGMLWQGGITTFGGTPSRDLIAASLTLILASIGMGFRKQDDTNSAQQNDPTE
jgi:hypothetical protein